ncbi:uncharacterized protein KY384_002388 [Bacidia gigantensis]|uniref:uncharacterized protein n=1 Tax=Bacidia gigantensis TaxID=2732470 RepID=UPI001D056CD7|nr:uncharacterized protein KY384_002388 [Bacidia gigantensis]KAG8532511.1 hypothetical protein KY384_002388 [Bacidia gigantensis]
MPHVDGWEPEIVVAIDFGMTCTGVAHSRGPQWAEPKTFQHWPGKMINELANKVPTMLKYGFDSETVQRWGFLCEQDSDIVDCFKLHLDPSFQGSANPGAPTIQQARQWFQDYLRAIHDHIVTTFTDSMPRWTQKKVEFVFSVPTNWNDPGVIADTERLIKKAGYGRDGRDHRVLIGLTEAEAAAVYALKSDYEKDDVVLVCDAGGGTTDVNALKLISSPSEPTRLKQLSWVEGRPVGSTQIDMEIHRLIVSRLEQVRYDLPGDLDRVADHMVQGKFERFKCSYGTALSASVPNLILKVPGLAPGHSCPAAKIFNADMRLSQEDIKSIFDIQIKKLLQLTDEQVDRVAQQHPGTDISYLVLSGGLGSSAYVKDRMRQHYVSGPGSMKPGVGSMRLTTVPEPQLAVVQGLVMDRIQAISQQAEIFSERCCRLSYGVVCKQKYNPKNKSHIGQRSVRDPRDRRVWVQGQIEWFIEQGKTVSIDGVIRPYSIKKSPGDEHKPWETRLVMSSLPRDQLPTNVSQYGSKGLCSVSASLKDTNVIWKAKNKHFWNRGKKHWKIEFDIKVVLGAADLQFVFMTKDKQVISKGHDAIKVVWQPVKSAPSQAGANHSTQIFSSRQ